MLKHRKMKITQQEIIPILLFLTVCCYSFLLYACDKHEVDEYQEAVIAQKANNQAEEICATCTTTTAYDGYPVSTSGPASTTGWFYVPDTSEDNYTYTVITSGPASTTGWFYVPDTSEDNYTYTVITSGPASTTGWYENLYSDEPCDESTTGPIAISGAYEMPEPEEYFSEDYTGGNFTGETQYGAGLENPEEEEEEE